MSPPRRPHCRYHHNNIIITQHKRSLTSPVACDSLSDWWQVGRKMAAVAECRLPAMVWLSRMFSLSCAKFQVKLRMSRVNTEHRHAAATCCQSPVSSGHRNDPHIHLLSLFPNPSASLDLALRAEVRNFSETLLTRSPHMGYQGNFAVKK